ncbi:hypothetical protein LTR84_008830 [Exophiala bonariae]|uniref:Carboxylesterase type B domain-containing protein n=1 Tax=Exophiala bonariae TaxID=1690606 RepID=A0AAV9MW26_9EURO|nr:hypothetical protein LTR84_008830 [Exophiala bonariae]
MPSSTTNINLEIFDHPTIGRIQGVKSSPNVVEYLGIQYATLSNAFARGSIGHYAGSGSTIVAITHGPTVINPANICEREQELIQARLHCTQSKQSATESLTLNISVPTNVPADSGLPVLVFVHGGGFASGSANHPQYNLTRIVEISAKDGIPIIAVGLNYRVGIAGFLISKEMKELGYKANNGLDDQRLGLRWIKHHIRGFGGDPERITFLGQSAGSVAGNIHLQSNEPLFEQYISMSGTAFSRPRRPEVGQKAYDSLVKGLGVAEASPYEQARKLLSEVENMGDQARRYNLGPTVDGDIVPEALVFRNQVEPESALKTFPGLRHCRRILVGDCQFDGTAFESRLPSQTDTLPQALIASLKESLDSTDARFVPAILSRYGLGQSASPNSTETTRRAILDLGNDIHFALPALALAKIWSKTTVPSAKAFLYHFNCPNPWDGPWKGEANHILDIAFALQNYNEQLSVGQRQCAGRFGKDFIRFVNGEDVWGEYRAGERPTSMIYSAQIDGEKDDSHLVHDESSASTGRRTFIQELGAEHIHDKVLHSWQVFMSATRK